MLDLFDHEQVASSGDVSPGQGGHFEGDREEAGHRREAGHHRRRWRR